MTALRRVGVLITNGDEGDGVDLNFDPRTVTTAAAIEMRPAIDYAIRQLRMTGDFLDELIRITTKDRAEAHALDLRRREAEKEGTSR